MCLNRGADYEELCYTNTSVITQGLILELGEISINVFVCEQYSESIIVMKCVRLIIKHEVYKHDTIVFEMLLKLLYELNYDLVGC